MAAALQSVKQEQAETPLLDLDLQPTLDLPLMAPEGAPAKESARGNALLPFGPRRASSLRRTEPYTTQAEGTALGEGAVKAEAE